MRFPMQWLGEIADGHIERLTIGESGAAVFRIRRAYGGDLFIKSEPVDEFAELPGEIDRLRWLASRDLPAPAVLDVVVEHQRHWLLMSGIAGHDLATASDLPAAETVMLAAAALRTLHQTPIAACPFDQRLDQRLEAVGRRVAAGRIDEADFDEERLGRTTTDLLAELLATRPVSEDLVVTHGDACLPNLLADGGRFTGFIDCGRLGIADRHQDLALAARSIASNLGVEWTEPFFRQYGIAPDERRLAFYRLLDEFF